jgi:hypothetical protein
VTYLADRRRAGREVRSERHSSSPAEEHIKEALDRYRRDLRLMLGRRPPSLTKVDDVVMLEHLRADRACRRFIGDRIVRIKTLEAMLELVLEAPV